MLFKIAIVHFIGGVPQIAVEFVRRNISPHLKPSFEELENLIRERR